MSLFALSDTTVWVWVLTHATLSKKRGFKSEKDCENRRKKL